MAAMPSDRRFHPLTILFALGGVLRSLLAPILFAAFTARSRGADTQTWLLILMVPGLISAALRYWFSTYRYDETELVVRTGIFVKNERHIPYTRIQSVDAVQNVFHRLLGVVDVKVQTGTGGDAEATLSVLPMSALEEMRASVFEGRQATEAATPDIAAPAPAPTEAMVALSAREIALSGVIDNRGWVVISAAFGLLWEAGLAERMEEFSAMAPESLSEGPWLTVAAIAVGLFVVSPVLSVAWALVRLHGFTVLQRGEELLTTYGAFTRVSATIPLRRVQAVKIHQSPGLLLTTRVSIRLETAGGHQDGDAGADRALVAPILPVAEVPSVLRRLLPHVASLHTDAPLDWQPVDARAGSRRVRLAIIWSLLLSAAGLRWLEWPWALTLCGGLLLWSVFAARMYVRSLAWLQRDDLVAFRSGWLWKTTTFVPMVKAQVVDLTESPFDRRWGMASISVDTAGAGPHAIDVPYLPRATAEHLRTVVAAGAASTEYRW